VSWSFSINGLQYLYIYLLYCWKTHDKALLALLNNIPGKVSHSYSPTPLLITTTFDFIISFGTSHNGFQLKLATTANLAVAAIAINSVELLDDVLMIRLSIHHLTYPLKLLLCLQL